MKAPSDKPLLEAELIAQLAEVEKKLSDLEAEKRALQRLLTRVREQSPGIKDVTRANSFSRILTENKILEVLDMKRDVEYIFIHAKTVKFDLNENTFRSYLHRLKERGLIESPRRLLATLYAAI